MIKITWETKEDYDDVLTCLIALGRDKDADKVRANALKKGHKHKKDKDLADKIDGKVKGRKSK